MQTFAASHRSLATELPTSRITRNSTPAAFSDSSGSAIDRCEYDAYGNPYIVELNFAYDALGRRIRRFTNHDSQTTYYYYNNNWQVLSETNASGTTQRLYVYGNYIDEVLFMKAGG